jgi:hypothetical protein
MCDYSLHNVRSRPAKAGDKLTTRNFDTGTRGFSAPEDANMVVCVLPGTELAFKRLVMYSPRGVLFDEEVGRQILNIFMKHHVGVNGVLRRNNFVEVRDADFQRGLNKAIENRWIKIKLRDRYTYELTEAGLAAGLNAGLPSKPSV